MIAEVTLWGTTIGAVEQAAGNPYASFEYDPDFATSGRQVCPLMMPLGSTIYRFPQLPLATYHGLPGLLADSIPDDFGNALINAWLARQNRTPDSFSAIERLCYTGTRGMGALEFAPAIGPRQRKATPIDLDALVRLASEVLADRAGVVTSIDTGHRSKAMKDILRIGTSAGGARAKAVIAWNPATHEVRSGQIAAGPGFEYWLLKFDGMSSDQDDQTPQGYGLIEYAYSLMARQAGISMSECRILTEHHRRHFMTKRFDRLPDGGKLHMLSLGSIAHFDFKQPGVHAYEEAFLAMRRMGLPQSDIEEQYRRMVFNIVARNQDDHVKNIAFLMDQAGTWSLAPAYDVNYSYKPEGRWTARHQMSMNGKVDGFTTADFRDSASTAGLPHGREKRILQEVIRAVSDWPAHAEKAEVGGDAMRRIQSHHRLAFPAA